MKKLLLATAAAWVASATCAYAMPAAIGGIGALIGGIGAGGISLGSLAIGVASMGAQWLLSKMMAPEQKQRGIKTRMDTGGDNPPTFIFGEYATSGQLVYANTLDKGSNIPEACLVYVICLSTLPIEAVSDEVYINSERCTIDTGSSWNGGFMEVSEYVKGGDDGGYCLMKFHLGDQNSVDDWMMDKFGSDPDRPWDNQYFLPGCAYAIVQCWYSNRGIWTGLPEFRFTVKGAKFYDPRKDSTVSGGSGSHRWNNQNTWEYTKNPKVIEYNFIRGIYYDGEHYWGGRAEEYRLPLDYWFAAMNVCDENVERKDEVIINRYEIGGEISLDDKPIEVINEINKSCDGYTTEYGGTYKTWCGGFGLSVGTITDDDWMITAELETNRFQARQNTYNTAYTTYPEPKQQWEVKDGPRYRDNDAVDEDGEELALDLALPFVFESNQAQRIARAAIKDSRRQVTHAGQLPPFAYVYEPFDRVTYVSDMFGYIGDGKDFVVATKDDLPNVNQQILLREINPDDHAWLVAYEQDWEAAPLVIVGAVDLVLDVDVFADEVESATGKDKPAIRAEWDWGTGYTGPGEIDVRYIDWRIRRAGATKIIDRGKIEAPEDDEGIVSSSVLKWGKSYEIQFRAVPFGIRASEWTAWKSVTMGAVDVPTGLTLTQEVKQGADGKLDFFVKANWDDATQDNDGYGVKITIDGDDRYHRADDSKYKFPVKAPETVQVEVRTRAADGGTPSAFCTPVAITVTKKATGPGVATGVTVTVKPNVNIIDWDRCTDDDYKESIIYRATVNVFASATEIDRKNGKSYRDHKVNKGTKYYYWVIHVNRSDVASASASSSGNGDTVGVILTDTDTTTLAAPTGISLSQANRDVDKDGTVDIALLTTFSGGVSGAAGYEMQWLDSAGQTASARADSGSAWFKANTQRSYQARWRTISWNGQAGAWSSYTSSVTPAATTGAPAAPVAFVAFDANGRIGFSWNAPTELDYSYSELAINGTSDSNVRHTTTARFGEFTNSLTGSLTIYARHVNTSGLKSSWSSYSVSAVAPIKMATSLLGTSAGSVNAGVGDMTFLAVTFVAASNASTITINLGSRTWTGVEFVNNESQTFTNTEVGGGSFSFSKSGGGSFSGVTLSAITVDQ